MKIFTGAKFPSDDAYHDFLRKTERITIRNFTLLNKYPKSFDSSHDGIEFHERISGSGKIYIRHKS